MAQRLIPGIGYVDQSGSGQRLIPGIGYIDNSVSGGGSASVINATTDPIIFSGGVSVSGATPSIVIAPVSDDIVFSGGASITAAGSIVTDILVNNTGSILVSQAVAWSWFPNGRIGSFSLTGLVQGSGTTSGSGALTVTGLPTGPGILLVAKPNASAVDDHVYYQAGTVT